MRGRWVSGGIRESAESSVRGRVVSRDSLQLSLDVRGDHDPEDQLAGSGVPWTDTLFLFPSQRQIGAVPRTISLLDDISSRCPIVWGK